MKNLIILFLLLTLIIPIFIGINSYAQRFNVRTYSVEDGLVQSTVFDIIQDRRGYIWFATSGGLSIYNGKEFQDLTTREGLITNRASAIIEDKKGNIWIGTDGGIVIVSPSSLFKTTPGMIINITTKNGLVGNTIRAILEDSKGSIWIGTTQGISKIDPSQNDTLITWKTLKQLTEFKPDTLNLPAGRQGYGAGIIIENMTTENGLVDNSINHIMEDSKGNIWFATNGGISKIIPGKRGQSGHLFRNFTTIDALPAGRQGLNLGVVNVIFEDKKGVFWIATRKGLLKTILNQNYNAIKRIVNINDKYSGVMPIQIYSILQDDEDNLWFGRTKFDGENWEYFHPSNGFTIGAILSSLQDREGNIWIGTAGYGVSKYIGKTFENYTVEHGLSKNNVRAIIEDQYGNIWIGTAGGVSKFHPRHTKKELLRAGKGFEIFTTKNGLIYNSIWSLMEDKHGNIWIGTGNGLSKYTLANVEGNKGRIKNFHLKDGLKNPAIMALLEDSRGNIWVGTFEGLSKLNINRSKESDKSFITYLTSDGLIDNSVLAIYEDSRNNLWIGTRNGLSRLILRKREESAEFEEFHYTFENFTTGDGLGNNKILSIAEDNDGNIWFGTGRGISRYTYPANLPDGQADKKSRGTFKNYTAGDGLSSDTPYLLIFDNDGYLYVGTNKGVDKFELHEDDELSQNVSTLKKIKHFGNKEGLLGIETNHNATCKDQDGNIWFGTISGAIKYKPKFDQPNTVEPLTQISKVQLFFEDVDWSDFSETINSNTGLPQGLVLAYDQNYLTFDFIGISLTIPEKVRYRYKLEGLDYKLPGQLKTWSPVTQETSVTYFSLPPGNYIFMVKACNNDGLWNKIPATFSFTITSPFWQTWWFYILCVLSVIGAVYGVIKTRVRKLQKKNRILTKVVKEYTLETTKQKEKIEILRDGLTATKIELKNLSRKTSSSS